MLAFLLVFNVIGAEMALATPTTSLPCRECEVMFSPVVSSKTYGEPLSFRTKDFWNICSIDIDCHSDLSKLGMVKGTISGISAYYPENDINYPLSTVVTVSSGYGRTNGFIIGPHHILTVAHRIYSKDAEKWADEITINVSSDSSEKSSVVAAHACLEWTKTSIPEREANYPRENYDYCVLIVKEAVGYKRGWMGLANIHNATLSQTMKDEIPVKFTSYSFTEQDGPRTQTGLLRKDMGNFLGYNLTTVEGDCGCPLYFDFDNKGSYAIAHHILNGPLGQRYKPGVLLKIGEILSNTWMIDGEEIFSPRILPFEEVRKSLRELFSSSPPSKDEEPPRKKQKAAHTGPSFAYNSGGFAYDFTEEGSLKRREVMELSHSLGKHFIWKLNDVIANGLQNLEMLYRLELDGINFNDQPDKERWSSLAQASMPNLIVLDISKSKGATQFLLQLTKNNKTLRNLRQVKAQKTNITFPALKSLQDMDFTILPLVRDMGCSLSYQSVAVIYVFIEGTDLSQDKDKDGELWKLHNTPGGKLWPIVYNAGQGISSAKILLKLDKFP